MFEKLRLSLLVKEVILFSAVPLLGLAVALRYQFEKVHVEQMSVGYSVPWFLISMAVAIFLVFVFIKFFKFALPFKILMNLTIFIGALVVIQAYVTSIFSYIIAVALVILYWYVRNILVHDFVMIVSIAGVATYLGLLIPATAVLILFGLVAIYDVIAVFKTGHMITMFKSMAERGAMMALVIPEKFSFAKQKLSTAKASMKKKVAERGVIFIGTGDAAFPAILTVSALQVGLYPAIGAAVGGAIGMIAVHFLLLKIQRPLPALPPIAAGSALGYLIGFLI